MSASMYSAYQETYAAYGLTSEHVIDGILDHMTEEELRGTTPRFFGTETYVVIM